MKNCTVLLAEDSGLRIEFSDLSGCFTQDKT